MPYSGRKHLLAIYSVTMWEPERKGRSFAMSDPDIQY